MKYYIGIDLGTSACKGILTDREGHILGEHSVSYAVSAPYTNWSEQAPEDWYRAAKEILRVLSEGREEQIAGVGIAGQMHGLVMLDEHDEVIRPAILWNDGRSAPQTAYLNSLGVLPAYTGNIAFPGFTAPKILWVKENEPENFAKAKKICLPKDYLAYKLTGVFSSEYSDAAGMLLLDVQNKCWSQEMCKKCGITQDMLPVLYESYEATGKLKAEYGLPNAVLCAGAGDNAGAAIGTATLRDGDCSISLGTSGTIFLPCDEFNTECGTALHNFAHANGKYHLMGCILSAASCNKWWVKDILNAEYGDPDQPAYGSTGVLFLPYLTGERCPHNDVDARGAFVGLSVNTTREDMNLAVLEGVAYALRDCVEAGGVKIGKAVLCGGGAVSEVWQRVIANVLGVDIYLTETEQGPSMGGALLAMVACGEYASVYEAADATVKKTLAVQCDPALMQKYDRGYAVYKQLYPALKSLYQN
jgi:xylulokinase